MIVCSKQFVMAARIPISWIFLIALLGLVAFFGYHIFKASSDASNSSSSSNASNQDDEFIQSKKSVTFHPTVTQYSEEEVPEPRHSEAAETAEDIDAPVITQSIPHVPAQTEQDLRATRQVQETPPSMHYDSPEAIDPLNRTVHMDAEFGSNLRHPEQMMERRPRAGIAGMVPSGLGSEASRPGGHNAAGYAPEMAQNGGEFMNGISAFDGSDSGGIAFSII
jgi:hypothetical protein